MVLVDFFNNFKPNTYFSFLLLGIFITYLLIEIILCARNKGFAMNAKPLTEQYLFKQAIRIPLFSALFFGVLSWIGHSPQFDSEGFSNFITISKLPIGLMSLTIPFVAVVNNMHRTIQTNAQIIESQKKNISDSYYSHFKYITDYFSNLPKRKLDLRVSYNNDINYEYSISYPVHLYKFLYSKNNPTDGTFNTNINYVRKITDLIVEISKNCSHIIELEKTLLQECETNPDTDLKKMAIEQAISLHKIESNIEKLHKMLCINSPRYNYHYSYTSQNNSLNLCTDFGSTKELSGRIEIIYQFMMNVLEITSHFSLDDIIKKDKGNLMNAIDFLRKNDIFIFRISSYESGNKSPSLVFNGDNLATEN